MKINLTEDSFLMSVIDNTPAAYLVIDKDYNVVFANSYIVKIAGISQEEVLKKKCYEVHGHNHICDKCVVEKAFRTGKKEYRLNKETDRAGNERYNDNYAVPIYNPDGSYDYVIEILTDRTEEMHYQKMLAEDFYRILDTFSIIVEAKDQYTANHSSSVRDISMLIAERFGLSETEKRDIYVASSLHDIGKIGVPDAIINKPGRLTDEEYVEIKRHPIIGVQLLSKLSSFDYVKGNIEHHHERWDGKGYPAGLTGSDIPVGARIIAVADSYDAMTSDRPYRKGMGHNKAVMELIMGSGKQFDPRIVSAFLDVCNVYIDHNHDDLSILNFIDSPAAETALNFEELPMMVTSINPKFLRSVERVNEGR